MKTTTTAAGSKVTATEGFTTAQIAAAIRADIKAAVKAGELPKATYSVRTQLFAGGSSITVRASLGNAIDASKASLGDGGYLVFDCYRKGERYTPAASATLKSLEAIVGAYNWDRSDRQSDYFCVRFYAHVDLETYDEECALKARLVAEAEAAAEAAKSTARLVAATGW